MKTALGSRSYDRMIDALQQDTYDESNYSILAKILNLEEYFKRLNKEKHMDKPDIPECLLTCWAKNNSESVSNRTLSSIFHKAKMGRVASVFEYNYNFTSSLAKAKKCLKLKCLTANVTPSESPVADLHFCFDNAEEDNSLSFVYKDVDRTNAENILRQEANGTYLVRKKDDHSFVISLKHGENMEHYLINHQKAVDDDQIELFAFQEKSFKNLKALLEDTKSSLGLLKMKTPLVKTNKVLNPVFVEKFSEELEMSSHDVFTDVAEAFGFCDEFKEHCSSEEGCQMTKPELAKWILETWINNHGEAATKSLFEASICRFEDGKEFWDSTGGYFKLA